MNRILLFCFFASLPVYLFSQNAFVVHGHVEGYPDGTVFTYGDVFLENEREFSAYNFEIADTDLFFGEFDRYEAECTRALEAKLPLAAYDYVLKCSHAFNLLDARGVISATERMGYILRVRTIAKACCASYLEHVVGQAPEPDSSEKKGE